MFEITGDFSCNEDEQIKETLLTRTLYVEVRSDLLEPKNDAEKSKNKIASEFERNLKDIKRRHRRFAEYCEARGNDFRSNVRALFDLLFPEGVEISGYISNRKKDGQNPKYVQIGIRLNPAAYEFDPNWPFPKACTFIALGSYPESHDTPLCLIHNFIETSDVPARELEREFSAVVRQCPQKITHRPNNFLPFQALKNLPAVRQETEKKLEAWFDFLSWKEEFIREKARGLLFFRTDWHDENQLAFWIAAENETILRTNEKALRDDLVIFDFDDFDKKNPWTFSIPKRHETMRLGRREKLLPLNKEETKEADEIFSKIKEVHEKNNHPWKKPAFAKLIVSLSDDQINRLVNPDLKLLTEDPNQDERQNLTPQELEDFAVQLERQRLLKQIPHMGYLSISLVGDITLIKRHRASLLQLQEGGGYAPYLTDYLFEAGRVSPLNHPREIVHHWVNPNLNEKQKEAVEKMISGADVCLIQGPPGTGKTTVIAEAIIQSTRRGERVLLASQAHTAVDNALDRLMEDPSLRVVRLARNTNRITDDGQNFTGSGTLKRYYQALAAHSDKCLSEWQNAKQQWEKLQAWYARAKPIVQSAQTLAEQHQQLQQHAQQAQIQWQLAEQSFQEKRQAYDAYLKQYERLHKLKNYLHHVESTDDDLPDVCDLDCQCLVEVLAEAGNAGLAMPYSFADWEAANADLRQQILNTMLQVWRRFSKERAAIGADFRRLCDVKNGDEHSVIHVASKVEIQKLQNEIVILQAQMVDDESLFKTWQEKTKELQKLQKSSGLLERSRYQGLFSQAETWCAPQANAQEITKQMRETLSELGDVKHAFDDVLKILQQQVDQFLIKQDMPPKPDETVLSNARQEAKQTQLDLHTFETQENWIACKNHVDSLRDDLKTWLAQNLSAGNNDDGLMQTQNTAHTLKQYLQDFIEQQVQQHHEHEYWAPMLRHWLADLRREGVVEQDWEHMGTDFLRSCNVVAITCNEREETLDDAEQISFDLAIIDEVSKATPLELLMPLMRARRVVLVGDHRQLPPLFREGDEARSFVEELEQLSDEDAEAIQQNRGDLFLPETIKKYENMVTASLFKDHFEQADESIRARLTTQFRMHPQIMQLVNHFYAQQLECGLSNPDQERAHGLTIADASGGRLPILSPEDHVLWLDTSLDLQGKVDREKIRDEQKQRKNSLEAELIAEMLEQIDAQSKAQGYSQHNKRSVGVVSFYANQCRAIRAAIRRRRSKLSFECLNVEINTVIRYQGKEKSIILTSLVRHNGKDPSVQHKHHVDSRSNVARFEFINVAFSRAQSLLIVFGARHMFEHCTIKLPNMDRDGYEEKLVYKQIFQQLDRQAQIFPADKFMQAPINKPKIKGARA